jgi:TPP-dependent pyruvate/acetoin dehydrogenase alpha subunit
MQEALPGMQAHGTEGVGGALDRALTLYRTMVRIRLISARMVQLQREGAVSFHASAIGEEGAICGASLACRDADWIFPGAREWAAAIVRGLPVAEYVHHAFGTASGRAKGHAPPDHLPARRYGVAPASGVVGAHVPQAVGFAWAARMKKRDLVTIALFGEGATSTGDFHNAMNFAGVFKAPCVLVCRNNGRATSTPSSRQTKSESFAAKAIAYGVARAEVDGNDALAVLDLVREGVARASTGKGALLVEAKTRPLEPPEAGGGDVLAIGDADPLVVLRRHLEREGRFDAAAHDAFVAATRAEIDAAVGAAKAAPAPAPATIFEDVYAEVPEHLARQKEAATWPK